jgi:hypothetical protein
LIFYLNSLVAQNISASVYSTTYDLSFYSSAKLTFLAKNRNLGSPISLTMNVWEATEDLLLQQNAMTPIVLRSGDLLAYRVDLSAFVGYQIYVEFIYNTPITGQFTYFAAAYLDNICVYGMCTFKETKTKKESMITVHLVPID